MEVILTIIRESTPLFLTGVFVFGLLTGSFLNVVILRVPAGMFHEWRCQCKELLELNDPEPTDKPPNIFWNRSHCPGCGHVIAAHENIPLISYVFLGGKCASCKQRISIRYPIIEAVTALMFLAIAWYFGPTVQALAAMVLAAFLIALTGIDVDHQLLPDNITLPLIWMGLLLSLFNVFVDPATSIIGALAGYFTLWTIFQLFKLLTGKEGMGYGDFKLLAALGAWMGWQMIPLIVLLSSVVGAAFGITLIILRRHQSDQPMPFGPFIAAAGLIALIWGDQIISVYLSSSGLR
ncbi:MAG: leader peptidase (prepilin peptidase)/N-methyltransferase [Lysobacterales bacterium]|jgi:leader peptidase (prepilin peptidase)/N-methyltransferase